MIKKVISMCLILVMITTLAACAQSGTGQQDSGTGGAGTAPAAGTGTDSASDGKKIEIEYWYGLGGKLGETMEETINKFNSMQDEVHVKGVMQSNYNETATMMQAAMASGDVPSSFLGSHHDQTTFAGKGMIEYLDSYIAADPDFNKDDIIASFMEYCTDENGKVYSLPVWGTTQVIYYRKDMFQEVGLDPDEVFATWQNVAKASKQLQEFYSDVDNFYGFEPMYGTDNLNDIAYSNGGSILSEDQRTVTIDSDAYIEAWEAIRGWIHDDKIMRIHFGGEGWEYWYKTIDDVMEGRSAGYVGSSGDQGDLDFSIIAAHVQPGFGSHPASPYVDPITTAIPAQASAEQKAAAFKWLTHLNKIATCDFSMQTGYVPVRSSAREVPEYKAHLEKNPQALIPIMQAEIGRKQWYDFTGGSISQAITDAGDLVEIENVPAEVALKEAKKIAQTALDEYWAEKDAG